MAATPLMSPGKADARVTTGSRVAKSIGLVVLGNALTPLVGALSGPILAQSLGVAGRGVVAAATAPLMFGLSVGTLGLPEAMIYRVAKDNSIDARVTRRVVRTTVLFALVLCAIIFALSGVLSDHDRTTQHLMWAATLFLAPGLVVIVYRGIATGLHKFRRVSGEQVVSGLSRAVILVGCLIFGKLTSTEAMLSIAAPVLLGGAAYAFVGRRNRPAVPPSQREINASVRDIYSYGRRVWFGSIGGILLLRLDQVVVAPLSDLTQLGLYVVAVNVAEILLIVVNAVHDVTFAADAASNDNTRAYSTSRLATAATVVIGLVMAATAPFLVPLLFGEAFRSSVSLVWILLGSIIVLVPGSVAGALLVARGHPQLRSVSLVLGAIVNAIVLVVAVPSSGAVGAAWATLAGNSVFALANLYFAWRRAHAKPSAFIGLNRGDLTAIRQGLRLRRSAEPTEE
jgi:O-antigen/teichoic acid export membrane protein